jgi:long-subunit acyl-CoA synthetase (AMP-forming)
MIGNPARAAVATVGGAYINMKICLCYFENIIYTFYVIYRLWETPARATVRQKKRQKGKCCGTSE